MQRSKKTMEKIVALAKTEGLVSPVRKSTAVLPTPGIMARWVWNLKIMSSRPGGANLSPNAAIM